MGNGEGKGVGQSSDVTLDAIVVDDNSFPKFNGSIFKFEQQDIATFLKGLLSHDAMRAVRDYLSEHESFPIAVGCPNHYHEDGSFLIYLFRKASSGGGIAITGPTIRINPLSRKRLTDRLYAVHENLTSYSNGFGKCLVVLPTSYYGKITQELGNTGPGTHTRAQTTTAYNLRLYNPQQTPELAGSRN
ncbi:TPA: hypothetical protein HA246_00435 [Candidatus Woesearchaeota archaeon]|nr:hypothetical protein [Candidatus Woesearchaeota archaeon]